MIRFRSARLAALMAAGLFVWACSPSYTSTQIVDSIVSGIITPLVGMIISKDFSEMTFEVNGSTFSYGAVIDAILFFISVAAVVFFLIVKPMQAIQARRARGEEPAEDTPAPSDEALLLTEIRDLLAARQV